MKKDNATPLLNIGRSEWVSFPDIGVPAIEAQILANAKLSLLSIFDYSTFKEGNDLMISFGMHPIQDNHDIEIYAVLPVKNRRVITLDQGQRQWCYSIETLACLGPIKKTIELFLVKELTGTFKLQLAAKAIKKKIRVNPLESHLTSQMFEND